MFACSKKAGSWLFGAKSIKDNKVKIIPNAIDTGIFRYSPNKRKIVRNELGISDDVLIIGHVGRFSIPKNHEFLIHIFKMYHDVNRNSRLLLVGDGELRNKIIERMKQLKLTNEVIMIGEHTDIADYYQAMDIFVFPSLWEGLGIAVIEAQSSGLPCIVSDSIPTEVDMGANLVTFLSLDDTISNWVSEIVAKANKSRSDVISLLKDTGYDVKENAMKLQKFYEELVR